MKAKPVKAPSVDPAIAVIVDQIGDLERELSPFKSKITSLEAHRKALRALHDQCPPGDTITAAGARYVAILGPCSLQKTVDIPRLVSVIGAKRFQEIASVTIRRVEHALPANNLIEVIDLFPTGPRSLTVSRKAA